MTDIAVSLLRTALHAPLATVALLWWAAAGWARRLRSPMAVLGPIAVCVWLWRERRHLRGLVAVVAGASVVALWVAVLAASPRLRWALVVAVPTGAASALWWSGVSRFGRMSVPDAVRTAIATMRTSEVLPGAVDASAPGARVVRIDAQPDGSCEAQVIGPPGMSHDDLVASLRDTLAESMLSLTGRAMESVSVLGAGARGSVRVRLAGEDRYAQVVVLP